MQSNIERLPDITEKMLSEMKSGLSGKISSFPMFPTYIKGSNSNVFKEPVIVIDAGGTNYRRALVSFNNDKYQVSEIVKSLMPNMDSVVTWEEFICFVADSISPIIEQSDYIAFCFSFTAEITPNLDATVISIDKEVGITGAVGKKVGASLQEELAGRGIKGKKIIVLNDSVAALLGASFSEDEQKYDGFIGQICGTGTNSCCFLPYSKIEKLNLEKSTKIIVNLESGLYKGLPFGDYDNDLNKSSQTSDDHIIEKLISGAYLGPLCKLIIQGAAEEKIVSETVKCKLDTIGRFDASYVDAWSCGEKLELICDTPSDAEFIKDICKTLFLRAAVYTCANLTAIMELIDAGSDIKKPVCICAEGSLIDKSFFFLPMLKTLLSEYTAKVKNRYSVIKVYRETTLLGSALACLNNK